MMHGCAWLSVALACGAPAAAMATPPEKEVACTAPAAPPAPLGAWSDPGAATAAGDADALGSSGLEVGKAVRLALLPTPEVRFPVRPDNPGGSVSYGGLARLHVEKAGTFRVALGSGAWVDLVSRGKALKSVGHGHGPACTGIRKMVDFPLEPGDYVLQIAANGKPEIAVLVAPLP